MALTNYIPWLLILVVGGALGWFAVFVSDRVGKRSPFFKKALLTGNELHFYKQLVSAAGEGHVVLCQVSMGALIDNAGADGSEKYWRLRSRYGQKIVDYVICDEKSMSVKVLVELDDRTHSKVKDRERDALTDSAGYKTLRFESKKKPDVLTLRRTLQPYLDKVL